MDIVNCKDCGHERCGNRGKNFRLVCCSYKSTPKIATNADRFRAMTDEELATVFEDYGDCPPRKCPYDNDGTSVKITRSDCLKCWLNWLRQEAKSP